MAPEAGGDKHQERVSVFYNHTRKNWVEMWLGLLTFRVSSSMIVGALYL